MAKQRESSSNSEAKAHPIPFHLFAPYNEKVALAGDWNDYQPIPMTRDEKGVWRVEVDLPDGAYQYTFQVVSNTFYKRGQTIAVADPCTLQVAGKPKQSIVTVKNGRSILTDYEWKHDDVALPSNDQLVIYEMHLGDFRGGPGDTTHKDGTFDLLRTKLDHLQKLGINAVELMPLNESGENNWGYSQCSYYALAVAYGTPDDFCRLVDECHGRGMRVIFDGVYNHMSGDAFLTQIDYSYWFYDKNPDEEDLQFGPKLNYEFYDEALDIWPAREYTINAITTWVREFHLDGIRFDMTRAIKYYELLSWFNDEAHKKAFGKPFFTIAEHLPQDPAITGVDGPIDTAWHDTFYRQLISTTLGVQHDNHQPFVTSQLLEVMDGRNDGYDSPYDTIHYLNNHDLERVMYLLDTKTGHDIRGKFARAKLGASLLLTAPGIPMLWMGEEFGQDTKKLDDPQPLHWSLLKRQANADLFAHYQRLIDLRKTNSALYSDTFEILANDPTRAMIAYQRRGEGSVVMVAANLRPEPLGQFEIRNPALENGRWNEVICGGQVETRDHTLTDSLDASEVRIYVKAGDSR